MKSLFSISLILLVISVTAQEKYITKNGVVTFEASVPTFEEVKAKNNNTTAIINTDNGEFAALVLVKGFRFKNALMEEHFNENYAESDDYPKATFKGKISDFSIDNLNNSNQKKQFNGTMTFHGKTKSLNNEVLLISKNTDGSLKISGELKLKTSDYDIEIPKIVSNKLSREVNVVFEFTLNKK